MIFNVISNIELLKKVSGNNIINLILRFKNTFH